MADAPTGHTNQPLAPPPGSWRWVIPLAAFLAGVVVTVIVVMAVDGGDDDTGTDESSLSATADPTATPADGDAEASSDADGTEVRVPAECVEAAELAQVVVGTLDDLAAAAGELDARRMQETLDVLQRLRPEVEAAATQCRDLGASVIVESAPPSPNATPSPSPTS